MRNQIEIDNSKSYATRKNLDKATKALDESIETNGLADPHLTRKMVCRNSEGRWTSIYFLLDAATIHASYISRLGFLAIG